MRNIPKMRLIMQMIMAGLSDYRISLKSGSTRNTVRKIRQKIDDDPSVVQMCLGMDDKEAYYRLFPSKAYNVSKAVPDTSKDLASFIKGTPKTVLYYAYVEKAEENGESPLKYDQYSRKIRKEEQKYRGSSEQSIKPGKDVIVFWLQHPVRYLDENRDEKIGRLFLGILPYSTHVFSKLYRADNKDNWIEAHNKMFAQFGGTPKALHAELSKSSCSKGKIRRHYEELAIHYNMYIVLDGSEQYSIDTMQIADWFRERISDSLYPSFAAACDNIRNIQNDYDRITDENGTTKNRLFYEGEYRLLSRLQNGEYLPAETTELTILYNSHVQFQNCQYSVPYEYALKADKKVKLELKGELINIFYHGKLISTHIRKTNGGYQTNPKHMPVGKELNRMEWNPDRFIGWAETIGPDTKELIGKILKSDPIVQKTYRRCMAILSLSKKYGTDQLEEACGANEIPPGVSAVKVISEYLKMNYGADT